MEQFTFYELYADILQSMDDISAGKLASCICAYEFEDREPAEELSDKENFYWSNVVDILKEVKETENAGKIPKKFNLQGSLFGNAERYKSELNWSDVAAKRATDEELKKERNIFRLARSYEQKYMQKP